MSSQDSVARAAMCFARLLGWGTATDPYGRVTTFIHTMWCGLNVLSKVAFADVDEHQVELHAEGHTAAQLGRCS